MSSLVDNLDRKDFGDLSKAHLGPTRAQKCSKRATVALKRSPEIIIGV